MSNLTPQSCTAVGTQKRFSVSHMERKSFLGRKKLNSFLGNVPAWKKENIPMATKVNPWGGKGLGRESVFKQFETSLTNMKVEKGLVSR